MPSEPRILSKFGQMRGSDQNVTTHAPNSTSNKDRITAHVLHRRIDLREEEPSNERERQQLAKLSQSATFKKSALKDLNGPKTFEGGKKTTDCKNSSKSAGKKNSMSTNPNVSLSKIDDFKDNKSAFGQTKMSKSSAGSNFQSRNKFMPQR